jgi:hypothetical protein
LVREFGITGNSLTVLVLGLIEDNWSPLGDLSLCDDLANVAGIVVGCIEETWIPCARNTGIPAQPSWEAAARDFGIDVRSRPLYSGQ